MKEPGLQGPGELEFPLKEAAADLPLSLVPRVKVRRGQQSWPSSRKLNWYVKLLNDN